MEIKSSWNGKHVNITSSYTSCVDRFTFSRVSPLFFCYFPGMRTYE